MQERCYCFKVLTVTEKLDPGFAREVARPDVRLIFLRIDGNIPRYPWSVGPVRFAASPAVQAPP